MRKIAPALCLVALLAGASLGCINHQGQLTVYLTDSTGFDDAQAALGIQQVNVEIVDVALRDADSRQFLTLAGGSRVYELIGLQSRLNVLALADALDVGTYDAVRITFAERNSSIVTAAGRKTPLVIEPVSIIVPVIVRIADSNQVAITLDFHATASISQKGNGTWVLRPVVTFSTAS